MKPGHAQRRAQRRVRGVALLIAAGMALGLVWAVSAQAQLPGVALTSGPGNDFRPTWSPDGSKIAFFSNRAGDNDIWLIDLGASEPRQLTSGPADDRRPSWSPDGEWIVFDSDRSGNKEIWVVSAGGGDPVQVTHTPALESFPAWSPDGATIAYYAFEDGVLDLWRVPVEGLLQGDQAGDPQRVVAALADEKRQDCTFACHVPAWSPDGQQIAYVQTNHTEVWVVAADGSNPHPVGNSEEHVHFPTWTEDGKLLMLSEHRNDHQEPVNDIWVVNADGSDLTLLFADVPHGGPFYWNPANMQLIAFHSPRAGDFDLYTTELGDEPVSAAAAAAPEAAPEAEQAASTPLSTEPPAAAAATAEAVAQASQPSQPAGRGIGSFLSAPLALFGIVWLGFTGLVLILGALAAVVFWLRRR